MKASGSLTLDSEGGVGVGSRLGHSVPAKVVNGHLPFTPSWGVSVRYSNGICLDVRFSRDFEEASQPFSVCPRLWSPKATPTSYRRNDLVQEFHACSLPDLLDDGSQLLISLFKVAWGWGRKVGVA